MAYTSEEVACDAIGTPPFGRVSERLLAIQRGYSSTVSISSADGYRLGHAGLDVLSHLILARSSLAWSLSYSLAPRPTKTNLPPNLFILHAFRVPGGLQRGRDSLRWSCYKSSFPRLSPYSIP